MPAVGRAGAVHSLLPSILAQEVGELELGPLRSQAVNAGKLRTGAAVVVTAVAAILAVIFAVCAATVRVFF